MANIFYMCHPCEMGDHHNCTPLIGEHGNEFCNCKYCGRD